MRSAMLLLVFCASRCATAMGLKDLWTLARRDLDLSTIVVVLTDAYARGHRRAGIRGSLARAWFGSCSVLRREWWAATRLIDSTCTLRCTLLQFRMEQ